MVYSCSRRTLQLQHADTSRSKFNFGLADQNEGAAGYAIRGSNPGMGKRLFSPAKS